ncbi:MAG TPA: hypothetical protein VJY31_10080 [Buttiauxella sp.]|nr:hypothetical protein [Buttiauxella sp.]
MDDGQNGGGVNDVAQFSMPYKTEKAQFGVEAYSWKEDGISDKGMMLNFKRNV